MQRTELEKLSRKELQSLAKIHGIKANLSNSDIISKLCDVEQPVGNSTAPVEQQETEQQIQPCAVIEPTVVETVVEMEVIPVVSEVQVPIQQEQDHMHDAPVEPSAEYIPTVGDTVDADVDGKWVHASVKRLNKKTARVVIIDTGKEFTLKFTEMRPVSAPAAEQETIPTTEDAVIESASTAIEESTEEHVIEVAVAEESVVEEVAETAIESEAMEVEAAAEEVAVETDAVYETIEVAKPADPTPAPLATIRVDYLEPLSCPRAPPTPLSCSRPSVGWNSCTKFSLEDSAVKSAGGPSSRRKERRKARRSAMKQLAESMKLEGMEVVEEPELQNEAQVAIESTPLLVPAPIVSVTTTSAASVAPVASAAAGAGAAKEMLPRMNKAQLMRVGAIQKKIVSTEMVPPASTAFTIAAKTASAATPAQARHSISAPSSVAASVRAAPHSASTSAARPALKVATPLSGPTNKQALSSRASIAGGSAQQTSGLKRKLDSTDRSSSVHSNAPDFKRMHSKQFGSLKSITECVEQDKHVGVRMTIAMESAMTTSATKQPPTTSANPSSRLSTIAEVSKPAANPFNKVINKSYTPGKAAATPAPLALSRPTTGINTSANIVKSRTVTSFVNGSCASGGAGQKVNSFLNNENEKPSGNSFLKSKDLGSGSAKHRSVSMSGSNFGHTQQKLQML